MKKWKQKRRFQLDVCWLGMKRSAKCWGTFNLCASSTQNRSERKWKKLSTKIKSADLIGERGAQELAKRRQQQKTCSFEFQFGNRTLSKFKGAHFSFARSDIAAGGSSASARARRRTASAAEEKEYYQRCHKSLSSNLRSAICNWRKLIAER